MDSHFYLAFLVLWRVASVSCTLLLRLPAVVGSARSFFSRKDHRLTEVVYNMLMNTRRAAWRSLHCRPVARYLLRSWKPRLVATPANYTETTTRIAPGYRTVTRLCVWMWIEFYTSFSSSQWSALPEAVVETEPRARNKGRALARFTAPLFITARAAALIVQSVAALTVLILYSIAWSVTVSSQQRKSNFVISIIRCNRMQSV